MFFKLSHLNAITVWLVLVLGILFEPCAIAEEEAIPSQESVDMSITLGLVTRHVAPGDDTNEDSDFIALSYDQYSISRFKNSYDDETWFGGVNYRTPKLNIFKASDFYFQGNLYAGLVYGYKDHLPNLGGVTPAFIPTIGLGYNWVCLEMLYFPTPSGGIFSSALRFDLSWRKASGSRDQKSNKPTTPQASP
jgi:hypothetical protein